MEQNKSLITKVYDLVFLVGIISMALTGLLFMILNLVFGEFLSGFFIAFWPFVVAYFLYALKEFMGIRRSQNDSVSSKYRDSKNKVWLSFSLSIVAVILGVVQTS